jgi:hypothetical protein
MGDHEGRPYDAGCENENKFPSGLKIAQETRMTDLEKEMRRVRSE